MKFFLCAVLLSSTAFAGEVKVTIKGMVCSFCATGLKKTFGKEKGVEKVMVSLETKTLSLEVNSAQGPSDARIKELVNDAGYDVATIERK